MADANLLVTFDPVHQESAKAEIEAALKELGKKAKILSIAEGMAQVSVDNPREVVKSLKKVKTKFSYTFYWWPVDEWCKSSVDKMKDCVKKVQTGIKKEESWKMDLAKRKITQEYPKDLIIKLTDAVDKPKVDLSNPDKIIKVEIVSDKAAISLLTPNEIFKAK